MISTSVSKDKLFRDFKKLEGKIKTKQAKKKALRIKKAELEMKIVEINQGNAKESMNKMVEEKEVEIQNLKKQAKLPVESPVQTVELNTVLQEKEVLQTELQNTKAIVGTIKDEKATLEDQIKNLNEKFDNMTTIDSSISFASELGSLSVKELELKNTQEELAEEKKTLVDKVNVLTKTWVENENLRKQVEVGKQALRDTKFPL